MLMICYNNMCALGVSMQFFIMKFLFLFPCHFLLLRELGSTVQLKHYSAFFIASYVTERNTSVLRYTYTVVVTFYKLDLWDKGHKSSCLVYPASDLFYFNFPYRYAVCMYNATVRGIFLLNKGSVNLSRYCIFHFWYMNEKHIKP